MASTYSQTRYDVGDRVKLQVELRDEEAEGKPLIDPEVLSFKMLEPDQTETAYSFGVDTEVVKLSTGTYCVRWDIAQAGTHWARWQASGNVGAAEERGFHAIAPKVAP
jgi:hypothetical protein